MKYILLFFVAILFTTCIEKGNEDLVSYDIDNNMLIKKTFMQDGKLLSLQHLNNDSIPKGAEFFYSNTGRIKKWKWYDLNTPSLNFKNSKIPLVVVYYDTITGSVDSFRGNPFIRGGQSNDGNTIIEIINPPNSKFIIGLREFHNRKLVNQKSYVPISTDTTSWVTLQDYQSNSNNNYIIYFYIVDENNSIIDSSYQDLID